MNKIYLFTAAFAVMASLSGCSDTELASIDTAQEKTPIGFHTVGSKFFRPSILARLFAGFLCCKSRNCARGEFARSLFLANQ